MFSWIPIHTETAIKLLALTNPQSELLAVLRNMEQQGLTVIRLKDQDAEGKQVPLGEIDPLTFLASFNRGITDEKRRQNWSFLRKQWNIQADVPQDFDGIPVVNNMQSWFFPYAKNRSKDHVDLLWQIIRQAIEKTLDHIDEGLFSRCTELDLISINKLTIGLFWVNPIAFLPADKKTRSYAKHKGIAITPDDYRSYREWMNQVSAKLGNDFPKVSHDAHVWFTREKPDEDDDEEPSPAGSRRFWVVAPGAGATQWHEFYEQGIIAISWTGTADLRQFETKEEVRKKLQELEPGTSKTNDALACWEFARSMRRGDVVFAKHGITRILGYGFVDGDYIFDSSRGSFEHVRKVRWRSKGDWEMPVDRSLPMKTLTDITSDSQLVATISDRVGLRIDDDAGSTRDTDRSERLSYWWLNANPKIWSFEDTPVGSRQSYTSHNEKGHKRQKYRYFQEAKPGDIVVGYVTSPQREIVGICRITKGLHQSPEGERIEFEKIERLEKPILYETLQSHPDLANSEPIVSNQGSLFKLTESEHEVIRSLIDEANASLPNATKTYSKQSAMKGLFLAETPFDDMLGALREKKNLVLQGAPGVGKTFIAKRLAYALIGSDDPLRIEMIQFHQSYSYEDFIQGFRPTAKGHFELKYGIFHQFCRRAQRDEAQLKPYIFIIDEINRGNLSRIFGELMMLIEPDKRGGAHAIPLAYAQDADERFYVPENIHLLGLMNTADRSLAMVDYALRRRFRFATLKPEFRSDGFQANLAQAGADAALIAQIVSRMVALNESISADTKNLGLGYQVGHSFFCPASGVTPDQAWYRRVIESEVMPLIEEYWFDNEQKVKGHRTALLA